MITNRAVVYIVQLKTAMRKCGGKSTAKTTHTKNNQTSKPISNSATNRQVHELWFNNNLKYM